MPFELFLALRYLRSRRRRPLARITALAAILGIAIGVGSLIIALALANGFRDEMQDKILRGTAHLTVLRRDSAPIQNHFELIERIKKIAGVTDVASTSYTGALVITKKGASEYAVLRWLDRTSPTTLDGLKRSLTAGSIDPILASPQEVKVGCGPGTELCAPASVVVGFELAQRLNLHVGDQLDLTAGAVPGSADNAAPRVLRTHIAGIFRTGLYEYDATWIYLAPDSLAFVTNSPKMEPSVISVQTSDLYATPRIAANIRNELGAEYVTVDWQQANGPLFAALALERKAGAVIIGLIILIAALNITTTLVLVVVERRLDIAILGALGARGRSVMLIFMLEGAFIGSVGAMSGVAIGLMGCYLGQRFHLVSLPPDVYSISSVPFHPHARDVLLAALLAFGLSLLSTIYPARAAARVRPAETLRDNG
ncbi:MAG: FtsX-like permease family protein [Pyrinomonadaceae bacterium]